jgi:hypothetical protein
MNAQEQTLAYTYQRAFIKEVRFTRDRIHLLLEDGREIVAPLSAFPEIEQLTPEQRENWQVFDGQAVSFMDLDEVYHISAFLGENNSARRYMAA